jgi:hypothetical protein
VGIKGLIGIAADVQALGNMLKNTLLALRQFFKAAA